MTGLIPSKQQSDRGQARRGKTDDECTLAYPLLLGLSSFPIPHYPDGHLRGGIQHLGDI
jgi:hypothetical protein